MLARLVDELRVVAPARGVELERVLVHQHVREADDGVERRAQLVAHGRKEAALRGVGALRLAARLVDRQLLHLAVGDVAHDRDHLAARAVACVVAREIERTAAHLEPDEARGRAAALHAVAAHPELDRAALAARRRVGERRQVGGTVGDVHAVEQAVADEVARRRAEQRLGGRRGEQHRAVAAMPGDHVGHVAREQVVALLADAQEARAGARERAGAQRHRGREQRRRDDAEPRHAWRGRGRACASGRTWAAPISTRIAVAPSARIAEAATARREAESAASSGTTTSQIAANDPIPPVLAAITVTRTVSASAASTCAVS